MEIFKKVKNYPLYSISDLGRVRNDTTGMILKPYKDNYLKVRLSSSGNQKTVNIHSLVAIAFLNHSSKDRKIVVDHIDNDKFNNRADNLQIVSNRFNTSKDKKGGSSKHTGVHYFKRDNKWMATIRISGKKIYLGSFKTEKAAAAAYNLKLKEIENEKD